MLTTEINQIANGLTKPQADVLRMLDGRYSPLELNGAYAQVLNTLHRKGLVFFTKHTRRIGLRGPASWDRGRVVYSVRLSALGGAFIYNGGLDR